MLALTLAGCGANPEVANYRITTESTIEDFLGKPSVIVWGGTYCPHCRDAAPVFEKQVWDVYKDGANLWINVIDGQDGDKFPVDVAQGYNPDLEYNEITGGNCQYVPSWVILNEKGAVELASCGSDREVSEMVEKLDELVGSEAEEAVVS